MTTTLRHAYLLGCACARCVKERARRDAQGAQTADHKRQRRYKRAETRASREEQHGRYIDTGPQAWDDRDGGP